MRYLIFFFLIFLPSFCFADFSVAVDKATGAVKGYCNGECGVQGWIDDGYEIVDGVPFATIRGAENNHLKWTDEDNDGKLQPKEITRKTAEEIQSIKGNEEDKSRREQIVDLKVKRAQAVTSGYNDIVDDIDKKIAGIKGIQ